MGKVHAEIGAGLREWVEKQRLFFVATAPRADDGHVNLSPKGMDSLRILSAGEVAYLDMPGSGIETVAHLRENGRIVLMFCAFDGPPRILRVHGRGRPVFPGSAEFADLLAAFPSHPAVRSIVRIAITRVSTSCGFGVPLYEWQADRTNSADFVRTRPDEQLRDYGVRNNARSIDGLPGSSTEEARSLVIRREGARPRRRMT